LADVAAAAKESTLRVESPPTSIIVVAVAQLFYVSFLFLGAIVSCGIRKKLHDEMTPKCEEVFSPGAVLF